MSDMGLEPPAAKKFRKIDPWKGVDVEDLIFTTVKYFSDNPNSPSKDAEILLRTYPSKSEKDRKEKFIPHW